MRSALRVFLAVVLVTSLLALGFAAGLAMSPRRQQSGTTLVITDLTSGAARATIVPNGSSGLVAVRPGVACLVQTFRDVVDVRCQHGDQWSTVVVRCEPFEIGGYSRRYGMTFGAANGSSMTEVELVCAY